MLHKYHVTYNVRHYPWFHITTVRLATYYPCIREHTCIYSLVNNLTTTGSLLTKQPGRKQTGLTEEKLDAIQAKISNFTQKSLS
jgi:hypothetical protein